MDIDLFPDTIHRTTMLEHVAAAQELCELASSVSLISELEGRPIVQGKKIAA